MGLLNKRNIAKAKALAEKNKDKIASSVNKATDAIDKKTGGKHTDKLKKIDDAAKKFAGDDATAADTTNDATGNTGTNDATGTN
ncbi:MAG: antitoxin [Ilumatobacteraceae bacterium]|nr:antitoxin [Ilumatobacteraceae bacterium]